MGKRRLVVLILTCAVQLYAAKGHSVAGDGSDTTKPKKVLIVKANTYLENMVAGALTDSLAKRGITVETISISKLDKKNQAEYSTIIVFSALKASGQLDPIIKRYISAKSSGPVSNIMICTVYGEKWAGIPRKTTDAVSAATKTLDPTVVANRILEKFTGNSVAY